MWSTVLSLDKTKIKILNLHVQPIKAYSQRKLNLNIWIAIRVCNELQAKLGSKILYTRVWEARSPQTESVWSDVFGGQKSFLGERDDVKCKPKHWGTFHSMYKWQLKSIKCKGTEPVITYWFWYKLFLCHLFNHKCTKRKNW